MQNKPETEYGINNRGADIQKKEKKINKHNVINKMK